MKKVIAISGLLYIILAFPVRAQFAGGSGSITDPYRITTAEHMNNVRNYRDKCFHLMNNIDLRDYTGIPEQNPTGWVPIGKFTGYFNGNGYTISGLYMKGNDYLGLFEWLQNATVENLKIEATNEGIKGNGSFIGILTGDANGGSITNCHVKGNIRRDNISTWMGSVGGLIGRIAGRTTVSLCSAQGIVEGGLHVGGLIGIVYSCDINNCYADCNVSGEQYVGGFIGSYYESNGGMQPRLTYCYSSGSSSNPNYGAFFGYLNLLRMPYFAFNFFDSDKHAGQSEWATGKSTFEMKQQSTYRNWDFDNTWHIENGNSYPILKAGLPLFFYEYTYDLCGNRILRNVIMFNTNISSYNNFLEEENDFMDTLYFKESYIDNIADIQINVFPNPTQGKLKISIDKNNNINNSTLELYNINGAKIFSKQNLEENTYIDIMDQPTGIYVMRIQLNGITSEWKIIKQ